MGAAGVKLSTVPIKWAWFTLFRALHHNMSLFSSSDAPIQGMAK